MNYNDFKNSIIKSATAKGLTEYELYYTESENISAEALMHEINEFSTSSNAGACFRCIYQGRMGYASTELFTEAEAERLVEAAMENAAAIESEDTVFIHGAGDTYEKLEATETTEPSSTEMIESTLHLLEKLYANDMRVIDGSQTFTGYGRQRIALYNSKGLDLEHACDYSQMGAVAVVKDGEDMFNSYCVKTDDFTKFDMDDIAAKAVEDAVAQIGKDSVDSGVYNIVLSNKMMATMLRTFFEVFSAEQAQRGLSLLADKEGEAIASERVTIVDDPFCKDTFIRMPFDGEGVATRRNHVIEQGKLCTLLHNLATAHKAGVASTGNGRKAGYAAAVSVLPYNFYLEKGGAGSKEDIFAKVGEGIYVTALNGLHAGANAVTGDFSLAAEGFLISGGEKRHAVKNFTVSGNFYEMLRKIALVGDDLEFSSPSSCCFGAPTVMVEEISVAGK